jgi:hypothetical protein
MSAVNPEDEPQSYRFMGTMSAPVEESVREVRFIARQLRLLGPLILLVTLGNMGVLLWGIGRSVQLGHVGYQDTLTVTNIVIAMVTIAALGLFETLRKRGDAIFQELSDELQWHVGRLPFREAPVERPMLDVRVTLRTFSAAAELPLVPGRFGGAVYAALNLIIAIASVFLFRV